MAEKVKAEIVEEKKGFKGTVFGILSLALSPFGGVASIVFGILAIVFGSKSGAKNVKTMGIWGIILHVIFAIITSIVTGVVYYELIKEYGPMIEARMQEVIEYFLSVINQVPSM